MPKNDNFSPKQSNNKGSSKGNDNSPKFPIWIYVVLLMALLGIQVYFMNTESGSRIKYSTFLSYVEKGYVKQYKEWELH